MPDPTQTREPFATPEFFRNCLVTDKLSGLIGEEACYEMFGYLQPEDYPTTLADIIRLPESEQFYAECAYLNHWKNTLHDTPHIDHINLERYPFSDDGHVVNGVQIDISYNEQNISFRYSVDPESSKAGYEVQFFDTDYNLIYHRLPDQNPLTEWELNIMSDDPEYVNADGVMAFTGDHTNI